MSVYADRVQETSSTGGTGTLTLAGAVAGFRAFASAFSVGDTVRYEINDGTNWEIGEGVLVTSTTMSRVTVFSNSLNNTSFISFAAASKNVWCNMPAALFAQLGGMASNAVLSRNASGQLQGTNDFTFDPSVGLGAILALNISSGPLSLITNNTFLTGKDTGGTQRNLLGIDASGYVTLGPGGMMQSLVGGDDCIVSTPTGGQLLRGGALSGAPLKMIDGGTGKNVGLFEYTACLNADYSTSSSTVSSTNLSFAVLVGEVWAIEFDGLITTGTGGIKFQLTTPASSVVTGYFIGNSTAATAIISGAFTTINALSGAVGATAGTWLFRISLTLTITVAGTVALAAAAATNLVANKILAGSKMIIKRQVKV